MEKTDELLRAMVARVDGLSWYDRELKVYEPDGHVQAAVAAHVRNLAPTGAHWKLQGAVEVAHAWPIRGAYAGALVAWDPGQVTPYCFQARVCTRLLEAKCLRPVGGMSSFWAPSFVLDGGQAYLIDGHHGLTLVHLARELGLIEGPVPAFVHLPSALGGLALPRLDCDCKKDRGSGLRSGLRS